MKHAELFAFDAKRLHFITILVRGLTRNTVDVIA